MRRPILMPLAVRAGFPAGPPPDALTQHVGVPPSTAIRGARAWAISLVAIVVACAACNSEPTPPAPPPVPKVQPASTQPSGPPPVGVPHGGSIEHVAVTDQADAAVSLDALGGLRLWPTLDGTRQPIAIEHPNAQAVAIGHAGDDLLVAILDVAGSVRLIRYTRGGVVRGSAQVPGDVEIEDLVAIEGGVLVSRRDQTIERYDAAGVLRGRIALEPGEELGALAARRGGAAVLTGRTAVQMLADGRALESRDQKRRAVVTTTAEALRWIDLEHGLQWGARVVMPDAFQLDQLALAPSHHRFAAVAQADGQLHVFDGTSAKVTAVGGRSRGNPSLRLEGLIGFLDEDHVAWMTSRVEWWVAASAEPRSKDPWQDPWKVDAGQSDLAVTRESAAIGDGLVVSGYGSNLALQAMSTTHFLGWHDPASGVIATTIEGSITLDVGQRLLTLDRRLERTSEVAFEDHGYTKPTRMWWIDANHAVMAQTPPYQSEEARHETLELVDFRHKELRVQLGAYAYLQRVDWDANLRTVAVVGDGTLKRFKLDTEANTLVELPKIKLPSSLETLRMLDPEQADGANLVVTRTNGENGERLAYWIKDGPKAQYGLPTKEGTLLEGIVHGISPTGALYMWTGEDLVMRLRAVVRVFPHRQADQVSTDRTGDRTLDLFEGRITLRDPAGTERWHQSVWGAQLAVFSPDGTQVVIQAQGGVVALDANTGERMAMACGFAFGLMTKPPEVRPLNVAPVCEDLGT
ncbi:hypothetical protein BH11MYX1_BH11MYX1_48340 [soil metagenome]